MERNNSSVIDVIEANLDLELSKKELDKYDLTHRKLSELGDAINEFYAAYTLPEKRPGEFRPSISTAFTTSQSVGLDYVSGETHYQNFQYDFDSSTIGVMAFNLKRFLLYCHGIVLEDPLPYLLDYFRGGAITDYSTRRLPAVRALLGEYAEMADLLRTGILLPVSSSSIDATKVSYFEQHFVNNAGAKLPELDFEKFQFLAGTIAEEQYRIYRLNNRADHFFPAPVYVKVLKELLVQADQKFSSRELNQRFGISVIGDISAISPDSVSIGDLVKIRLNDQLFDDWRNFLGGVFKSLDENVANYSDIDLDYSTTVRERFSQWNGKIATEMEKGSVFSSMKKTVQSIGWGHLVAAWGGHIGCQRGGDDGGSARWSRWRSDQARDRITKGRWQGIIEKIERNCCPASLHGSGVDGARDQGETLVGQPITPVLTMA